MIEGRSHGQLNEKYNKIAPGFHNQSMGVLHNLHLQDEFRGLFLDMNIKEVLCEFEAKNDPSYNIIINSLKRYLYNNKISDYWMTIDDNFNDFFKDNYYIDNSESKGKEKEVGTITVKATVYNMTLLHNKLSNEVVRYLKNNGYNETLTDKNYVDISAINQAGESIFFELKIAKTVKYAIREAIGQLLEYNHYANMKKTDKMIIVTMLKPTEEDIIYIEFLRKTYNIPVFYQHFDMKKKLLSNEY